MREASQALTYPGDNSCIPAMKGILNCEGTTFCTCSCPLFFLVAKSRIRAIGGHHEYSMHAMHSLSTSEPLEQWWQGFQHKWILYLWEGPGIDSSWIPWDPLFYYSFTISWNWSPVSWYHEGIMAHNAVGEHKCLDHTWSLNWSAFLRSSSTCRITSLSFFSARRTSFPDRILSLKTKTQKKI